jgi:AbrB family looped-hinge helix DNA binding protein
MHATIYGRGQMVIPAKARQAARIGRGDVVSVEPEGDGRIVLIRLEKPKREAPKVQIEYRKGTQAVATAARSPAIRPALCFWIFHEALA